ALDRLPAPVLAYCRSGARSEKLAEMAGRARQRAAEEDYDIVVVGGGSAGIAAAASILKRRDHLRLAVVEPNEDHYYQPGWTMVGAGVFDAAVTRREEARLIPKGAHWVKAAARSFQPDANQVMLQDGRRLSYKVLIVCPGIKLDWDAIPGLAATLGRNGVTSNYRYDLAPYTHRLVKAFKGGRALFTQPVMPIKCAPRKRRSGGVLFGVPDYVPALMDYVERYGINLHFGSRLVELDGPRQTAVFERADGK
ncbi:hypothetical protein LTR94_029192, partial [Friedmanniomyces endolithicus]